ncbi:MAG: tRNA (cytidine(34)-2'-O)-methyltransferase [Myxococcota bacterium]
MTPPFAHVVLVEPEIPWNTGNAGRSCLAFGARLHLVEPLGFSLDERAVRRAGLDYWADVDLSVWPSWSALQRSVAGGQEAWFVTPEAPRAAWEVELGPCPLLVFGQESSGLPPSLRSRPERQISVPMPAGSARSLNVSTTVGILLYEVDRQARPR